MNTPPLITGATSLVALLGSPLAHSLSPAIHNHVYSAMGLPFVYVPFAVDKYDLHRAIFGLRACSFAGANVTIPHKRAVLPYCDIISDLSRLTGTANTLFMKNGLLHGTTTDWEGFSRALAWMNFDLRGSRVALLGNGGTARTFGFALASKSMPASLVIVGRDASKASALASEITAKTGFSVGHDLFSSPTLAATLAGCSLCVNCTSVGMYPDVSSSPLEASALHPALTVFDTIYNPGETLLCRMARKAGCVSQGGLRMLVFQALASCSHWAGMEIPHDIVPIEELQRLVESDGMRTDVPA
jgi:shikimate dehydrogenase